MKSAIGISGLARVCLRGQPFQRRRDGYKDEEPVQGGFPLHGLPCALLPFSQRDRTNGPGDWNGEAMQKAGYALGFLARHRREANTRPAPALSISAQAPGSGVT